MISYHFHVIPWHVAEMNWSSSGLDTKVPSTSLFWFVSLQRVALNKQAKEPLASPTLNTVIAVVGVKKSAAKGKCKQNSEA